MTNELIKKFVNKDFGEIEVLVLNGKEYFPATKVAKILGYKIPEKAVTRHCILDRGGCMFRRGVSNLVKTKNGEIPQYNDIRYIDEGNLYRLIVKSKLPSAIKFERWVFEEVLPMIRKTGAYFTDNVWDEIYKDPRKIGNLIIDYANSLDEINRLKKENQEVKNEFFAQQEERLGLEDDLYDSEEEKEYYRNVADTYCTDGYLSIGAFSKTALFRDENGKIIGRNRLFNILRKEGYLINGGINHNLPYQKYIDTNYFLVKMAKVNGNIFPTVYITDYGKNQIMLELQFKGYYIDKDCIMTTYFPNNELQIIK